MATGYDNLVPLTRKIRDEEVKQSASLTSIDTKLDTHSATRTSEATTDKLIQGTQEDLLTEILKELKILNLHQAHASEEPFTEEDIER